MADEEAGLRAEVQRWRRRAELWRTAADMLQLVTWQHDLVADVGEWSDEARALFGIEGEPSPDAFLRAVHPDDRAELARVLGSVREVVGEESRTVRHRIVRRDGEVRWLETRVRLTRDGEGRPSQLAAASIDRTDAVRSEEARRAAAREATVLDAHPWDAVFVADARGRYVEVNDNACDLLGFAREELLAMSIVDLLDPDEARVEPVDFEGFVAGKRVRRDRRLRRKDGGFVAVEIQARGLPGGFIHAIARDVTSRVAAEDALKTSEQTLRELGANLPALLWVREVDSERLLYANDAWESVLGRRPVVGEGYWQLVEPVHPEDLPRLVVAPLRGADQERDEEVRFVLPSGAIAWYRVCKFGIRDAHGKPYRVAGFCMDVTVERVAEERVRASLHEKEILLREVHHRVKNNLQVVSSLLRLQASRARAPGLAALLQESHSRVASMALVHDMLHKTSDPARIPFATYARTLGASLASTYGVDAEKVAIVVDAAEVAFSLDVAVPCGLILNEILSNALKHAYPNGEHGTITVELRREGARSVRLSVRDDGVGLPPDFDERRRASLGSKLIENLVEQIGGALLRTSSTEGTRHEIVFPVELDRPSAE